MRPIRISVISAGVNTVSSTRRLADMLAASTSAALARRGDSAQVHTVELRDIAHEITDAALGASPAPALAQTIAELASADALIATTPIFSASYSGLFKSFFDCLPKQAINGLPTILGATAGSVRHQMALDHAIRPLLTYLKAEVVNTTVFAAPSSWTTAPETAALLARSNRAAEQLVARLSATAIDRLSA